MEAIIFFIVLIMCLIVRAGYLFDKINRENKKNDINKL
jgi:hypothetical protein